MEPDKNEIKEILSRYANSETVTDEERDTLLNLGYFRKTSNDIFYLTKQGFDLLYPKQK